VRVYAAPDGSITWAAPVVRKFQGQPLNNLLRWAASFGGMRWEEL
jgi:hypothetical protein